jgi:FAD-dependent urate hydroxylase
MRWLADAVSAAGTVVEEIELVRGSATLRFPLAQAWAGAPHPSIALPRQRLHAVLTKAAANGIVPPQATRRAVSVALGDAAASVRFDDGTQREYDVVVGADGVGSRVRRACFPGPAAETLGTVYWRFVAESVDLIDRHVWRTYEATRFTFGIIPLGHGQAHCFVQLPEADSPACAPGEEAQCLEAELAPRHPVLAQMAQARRGPVHVGPARGHATHAWTRGRCVLLGDASHALSPSFSEGAALAMEDALVLAHLLAGDDDVDQALRRYESARRPRAAWAARMAAWQLRAAAAPRPLADPAIAAEHLRQMYAPLLRDPLAPLTAEPADAHRTSVPCA